MLHVLGNFRFQSNSLNPFRPSDRQVQARPQSSMFAHILIMAVLSGQGQLVMPLHLPRQLRRRMPQLSAILEQRRSAKQFVESMLAVLGLIVQNSSGPALQAVVGSDIVTELFVCNLKKGTAQSRVAASVLLVGTAQKVRH